jgi:hypothetical protein
MKIAYYIMQLQQIGNVGANEIFKTPKQPEEGYHIELDAINALHRLMKEGEYPFNHKHATFTIMPIYSPS